MIQTFVQPEPEHINPVNISANHREDNLSWQVEPEESLGNIPDAIVSSSEWSDSLMTDFQSCTEEIS